ncbi:hypothetical protein SUGI_1031740 [Cryptomeria japonica]|uniref:cytochrome P450 94A2 n=1 Tax=Cryptomeria japonica TaxID=3369 RepID=UPI002414B1C3|nr:cytochrome P450 94A2 [Cryptomeria japonica]GLJ48911.1 hypothetical protein SUGI_1031740 [Cryptomeria japonica]
MAILIAFLLFSLSLLINIIGSKRWNKGPYKGPTVYPLVGITFEFLRNRNRFLEWATDAVSRTPSKTFIVRRPGVAGFYIANPANVEHILSTKFVNYPKGERFSFLLHDFLGSGIFNVDGELWRMQRKVASYEFNTKSLRSFVVETVQWEIQNRLMPLLSRVSKTSATIDMQDVLHRFAFDNICKVAFGVDPACLHSSLPRSPFAEAFDDATHISSGRFFYIFPYLWRIKRFLNVGSERKLRKAIGVVDEFAMDIIRSRRKEMGKKKKEDLLSRFMEAVVGNPELEKPFDEMEIRSLLEKSELFLRDMVVSFIMAGRDTTSTALTWFFWLLSSRPCVEDTIRSEILQLLAARNGRAEEGESKWVVFSFEELKEMHYLHAALCESLRLCPPVPLDTKLAAADDVLPDGNVVRKGWFVSYSIYSMGRMESIWGSDCLEFKPKRWLKNGKFVAEDPYKFPVFQAGPRICLGKEMSFIQMKSVVASVLHRYSVKAETEYSPKYSLSITLRMKGGLPVMIIRL